MSNAKVEATSDRVTFEKFGREWVVPAKRHLSHILKMEERVEQGYPMTAPFLARTFLDDDQWEALVEIDPDEAQMDEFATDIAKAIGVGNAGNSEPSSMS